MVTSQDTIAKDGKGKSKSPGDKFNSWKGPTKVHFTIAIVVLLIVAGGAYFVVNKKSNSASNSATSATGSQLRASGIPSVISTPLANLMQLSPVPKSAAPNFTLTDQNGKSYSLSDFKGHSIVLEFMDPNCTDICPLIAQEFVDAYHNLGKSASNVIFMAVNVNKYHLSTAAVARFTNEHGLNSVPNWHFLTGTESALSQIWKDYGITVQAPSPTADVIHTSLVYFIGPNGHERFIAAPIDYHTSNGTAYLPPSQLSQWGKGIALLSKNIL